MKKKLLASLLTLSMVAAMLTGCGGAAKEEAPADTTEAATEEAAPAEETTEAAESTEAADPVANLIAATTDTVSLTVWASEEDQTLTTELLEKFKAQYPDVTFDIKLFRQR